MNIKLEVLESLSIFQERFMSPDAMDRYSYWRTLTLLRARKGELEAMIDSMKHKNSIPLRFLDSYRFSTALLSDFEDKYGIRIIKTSSETVKPHYQVYQIPGKGHSDLNYKGMLLLNEALRDHFDHVGENYEDEV